MIKLDAYRVHLFHSFFSSLGSSLIWTVMMVYQVVELKLTPLQLVLIGTTMETTIMLFEVPTGIVADIYSRRLSLIIGFFMIGVSYVLQGSIRMFEALLIGNILWGIGYTFTSGAYDAWMVDELGEAKSGEAFMRSAQIGRVAGLFGMAGGVVLGSLHLQIPILVGAAIILLDALFLALTMPENGFAPTPSEDRNTWQKMVFTFTEGLKVVRGRPTLVNIMAIGLFFGLFSEGWDRLWQTHMLGTFGAAETFGVTPIVLVTGLNVILMLLTIGATEIMRRTLDTNNARRLTGTIFTLTAMMVISLIGYGLAPNLGIALGAFFAFTMSRSLIMPLFATWSNQHIDSSVRATVLSMQSQVDAFGEIAGGPPVGVVGQWSLRAAFVCSGAILAPALFLLRRVKHTDETEPINQAGLAEV